MTTGDWPLDPNWTRRFIDEPEGRSDDEDKRSAYERDRDRVLYSSAFRRLAGITQITAPTEQHLLHNRLTHSLKVAQLGRRMAERLWLLDREKARRANILPDVVESAGLAHDLGHPPFGHATELVLHPLLLNSCGGFEGNAQSFRIVVRLAPRPAIGRPDGTGLNLTRATMSATLKYPRLRPPDKEDSLLWTARQFGSKWGAYHTEHEEFGFARELDIDKVRSANAILMDWADDISYATHDVEDFVDAGLIVPERIQRDAKDELRSYVHGRLLKKKGFKEQYFAEAFDQIIGDWRDHLNRFDGSIQDRGRLRILASTWLQHMVRECVWADEHPYIKVNPLAQYKAEVLKLIVAYYVIEDPSVNTIEQGRGKLVTELFHLLTAWLARDPLSRRVPVVLREHYKICHEEADDPKAAMQSLDHVAARATSDYLCSLTEPQVYDIFARMTGRSGLSAFGSWLT